MYKAPLCWVFFLALFGGLLNGTWLKCLEVAALHIHGISLETREQESKHNPQDIYGKVQNNCTVHDPRNSVTLNIKKIPHNHRLRPSYEIRPNLLLRLMLDNHGPMMFEEKGGFPDYWW